MRTAQLQELISMLAASSRRKQRPPVLLTRLKRHLAALERKGASLTPDERDVLQKMCEIIDAEKHGGEAWQLVKDISKMLTLSRQPESNEQQNAITHNLRTFTLAYQDLKESKVASGVLVDIGGRTFVATTAHSVPADPKTRLVMVGELPTDVYRAKPSIISFGTTDPDTLDIGFMELDSSFVKDGLGKLALPLSRVFPCGPGQLDYATYVCGFPSEQVHTTMPSASKKLQVFTFQSWQNTPLMPKDWNHLPRKHRPPHELTDIFVPYQREDDILCNGQEMTEILNQPHGLSGGGYWQPNVSLKQKIWSPEYYCLIGIQSAWWGRYLRATQIIHWLRLVWQHNSDLRQQLEAEFPNVDFPAVP